MMSMISVIVPVYNTEGYLGRCIDSILASGYREFELILVDDGSADGSPGICRTYAEKESRIKYIRQENRGASAARNRGLEESRGEWIVFVDSDDFISPDFLEIIAREERQPYDLLLFDSVWIRQRGRVCAAGTQRTPVCYGGKKDAVRMIDKMLRLEPLEPGVQAVLSSPWGKAYRRSLLLRHQIRFPLGIVIGEDKLFNLRCWTAMEACLYVPETVYFAEQRMDSATHACHPDYLQDDLRFERELKLLMERQGVFSFLEEAYYENVLANMAAVLIKGIFSPYGKRSYREKRQLCRIMREEEPYRTALSYNGRNGTAPRRLLLHFFRRRNYPAAALISKVSFFYLYFWRRM